MNFVKVALFIAILALVGISIGICSPARTRKHGSMVTEIHTIKDLQALFDVTPETLKQQADLSMAQAKKDIDAIIAIPDEQRTFENTALALDRIMSNSPYATVDHLAGIFELIHPDKTMRDAGHDTVIKMHEFFVDNISNNKKLYKAFKAYVDTNAPQESLNEEQRYFLDESIKDFERLGLGLPDEKLAEIKQLKKELAKLSLEFERNIATDNRTITVDKAGLKGLDESFIQTLKKDDKGNYILGVDYPTYFRVMENCAVEDTRRRLFHEFHNRGYPANENVLKQVIAKRDELAHKLGFKNYAAYDLDNQMVGSPERADAFLNDLIKRGEHKYKKEIAEWTKELPEGISLSEDGRVKPWDLPYILNQYKKKKFNIDEIKISEYFPMESTIDALLDIYRKFFAIEFEEVPVSGFWDKDVKLVKVLSSDKKNLLGYLLLDLHPRQNKYSHAAHAGVIPGIKRPDGTRTPTISTVIANFPKPTKDKPSLLKRNDVNTFFHEFGHALHAILGATDLASFAGTSVKRDFVEMPSQMLEEWLWDKDILQKVSKHYKTNEPLPDEVIENLLALKTYNSGYFVRRQGFLSRIALNYYKEGANKDPQALWIELWEEMLPELAQEKDTHRYASFGHLMGYSAKYYGYMWSKVFALDLFDTIKKYGLLNPEIGKKYIAAVIGRGGSQHPDILLKNFLGRAPRSEAFFRDMGFEK